MNKFLFMWSVLSVFFWLGGPSQALANNLSITNVSLEERNSTDDSIVVEFDISWDNSWRNDINHDAVWVFFKIRQTSSGTFYHGKMKQAGINPPDTSTGSYQDLEIDVPTDKMGAFIRRKDLGTGTVTSTNVRLKLDYGAAGLSDSTYIAVYVKGIEMVYVPTGGFVAGDSYYTPTYRALRSASATNSSPWSISSESTITTTAPGSSGSTHYYVSSGRANEDASGAIFSIGSTFPKGYNAFYCMKYELTEGQWVDFINTLTEEQQDERDITYNHPRQDGKATDGVIYRNTVRQSQGTGGMFNASTTRPDRAMTYISWMDLCAYLDWAGLRPMTELEFEKIARGAGYFSYINGEYAWGSTSYTAGVTFSGTPEDGTETFVTSGANVALGSTTYSLGDDYLGAQYASGPVRVGIFATSSTSTRAQTGASYYGAMEMTGNLWEFTVTVGNSAGRGFTGLHGDGALTTTSGHEGNANVTGWPHTDNTPTYGVTGSAGSAFRGGSSLTPVSDRGVGAYWDDSRWGAGGGFQGGRGVRTYTGTADLLDYQ